MLIGGAPNDGEEAPSSTNSKSNRFVDIFRCWTLCIANRAPDPA